MVKNFTSMPPWLPGIVTARLSPLTYPTQLNDGRVWKRNIDHIQETEEREKQNSIPESVELELEDWSYSIPVDDKHCVFQPTAATDASEVPNRYPARNQRAPQRLIEQTDI